MQGNLKGYDHTINLILEGCSERIYSQARGVEQVGTVHLGERMSEVGLYLQFRALCELESVEHHPCDIYMGKPVIPASPS